MSLLDPRFDVILDDVSEPGKHFYKIVDHPGYEKLPGVTTPLGIIDKSEALMGWTRKVVGATILDMACEQAVRGLISLPRLQEIIQVAKQRPAKERDDAATLGTLVHQHIDRFIKGDKLPPMDLPLVCLPAIAAFTDWWEQQDMEFVLGDTCVGSLVHGYGGSLDALARRRSNGNLVLLDWKTSKRAYDTHALQAGGGYHIGLEERFGVYAEEAWVIRFSKTEPVTFGAYQVADIKRSRRAFLLALDLWREMQTGHFAKHKIKEKTK